MDTFENTPEPQETPRQESAQPQEVPRQESPQTPESRPDSSYHSCGTGRRESPYANSPYVAQEPRPEYQYQPQYTPPKPPKKGHPGLGRRITAGVLTLALVAGGCLITAAAVNSHWEDEMEDTVEMLTSQIDQLEQRIGSGGSTPAQTTVSGDAMTPGQLYAQSVDSVVAISSTVLSQTPFGDTEGTASGSGFILSSDGYIVTNHHVIADASDVTVTTYDGTVYPAQIIGSDSANDLAVLKIEAADLPAAPIGSSSDLSIGDMVVAIGNPLGTLAATQTVGYVSGIDREVRTDSSVINMIQTDAAINPGNSGGPLFNMKGEVVGITTAKYSGTTGSGASIEGIGFAIPIDDVMGMITDLIDYGYITGAYLGVTVTETDAQSASMFGLPTGAYVVTVEDGGSADRAGIQPKDIIISLGGKTVSSTTELKRVLRDYKAGDTTTITVIRSGQELELEITLDEKPQVMPDPNAQPDGSQPEGDYDEWFEYFRRKFGMG